MQLFDVILTHSIISASTVKFKESVCLHEISVQKSHSMGKSKSDFVLRIGPSMRERPALF